MPAVISTIPPALAVAYPDGWGFYAWHGRRVPGWVIVAPSVEAITAEENVEVRRCAIESLGWDQFIAEAGLVPVTAGASADLAAVQVPDPGNPGSILSSTTSPSGCGATGSVCSCAPTALPSAMALGAATA